MTDEDELDLVTRKIFNKYRDAYQSRGWSQKYLSNLVGDVNVQQFNRAIRATDNTPRAKEIRKRAREILDIK